MIFFLKVTKLYKLYIKLLHENTGIKLCVLLWFNAHTASQVLEAGILCACEWMECSFMFDKYSPEAHQKLPHWMSKQVRGMVYGSAGTRRRMWGSCREYRGPRKSLTVSGEWRRIEWMMKTRIKMMAEVPIINITISPFSFFSELTFFRNRNRNSCYCSCHSDSSGKTQDRT